MFAEVAVPVYVNRTFTYHLPGDMLRRARVGCRVVVPFGKKFLTGFVVALHDERRGELAQSEIKDVEELVDEAPIIARDIMELTRWMSDYYYAPLGRVFEDSAAGGRGRGHRAVASRSRTRDGRRSRRFRRASTGLHPSTRRLSCWRRRAP